jgi:hypothetical protein
MTQARVEGFHIIAVFKGLGNSTTLLVRGRGHRVFSASVQLPMTALVLEGFRRCLDLET